MMNGIIISNPDPSLFLGAGCQRACSPAPASLGVRNTCISGTVPISTHGFQAKKKKQNKSRASIHKGEMAWWKIWESNRADGEPKTFNIVLGYFFLINYCVGTGFLGVPYAFFYSGYLAAIPTLIFTAFSGYMTSRWLIEVISRAQVMTYYGNHDNNIL